MDAGQPKFAIVRLRPADDVFNLFRVLVENGYPEVSFVNGLREELLVSARHGAPSRPTEALAQSSLLLPPMAMPNTTNLFRTSAAAPLAHGGLQAALLANSPPTVGGESTSDDGNGSQKNGLHVQQAHQHPAVVVSSLANFVPRAAGTLLSGLSSFVPPPAGYVAPIGQFSSLIQSAAAASSSSQQQQQQHAVQMQVQQHHAVAVPKPTQTAIICSAVEVDRNSISPPATTIWNKEDKAMAVSTSAYNAGTPTAGVSAAATNQQLRQRGSRAVNDDPSIYATCLLCQNRIMASRLSNLTNHVRRHAVLKQFQCCYCEYTHNEMAKVRLHMLHNHKDKESQPIDNISPEMQTQWDLLMEQCFPDYNKDSFSRNNNNNNNNSDTGAAKGSQKGNSNQTENVPASDGFGQQENENRTPTDNAKEKASGIHSGSEVSFTCVECGENVQTSQLEDHLRQSHPQDCCLFICALCGQQEKDQWKLRLHHSLHHPHLDQHNQLHFTQSVQAQLASVVGRFFPDFAKALEQQQLKAEPLSDSASPESSEESQENDVSATGALKIEEPTSEMAATPEENERQPAVELEKGQPLPNNNNNNNNNGELMTSIAEDDSLWGELLEGSKKELKCELCHRKVAGDQPLSTLLNHSKRHYHIKQFQCRNCSYSNADSARVKAHVKARHKHSAGLKLQPIDNNKASFRTALLQSAWVKAMLRCFPMARAKLDRRLIRRIASSGAKAKPGRPRILPNKVQRDTESKSDESVEQTVEKEEDNHCSSFAEVAEFETPPEGAAFESSDLPLYKSQCRLCSKLVPNDDRELHASEHAPIQKPTVKSHSTKPKLGSGEKAKPKSSEAGLLKSQYYKFCFGS